MPGEPAGQLGNIPGYIKGTAWMKQKGSGGNYDVCFSTENVENPRLYKFVSGVWVEQTNVQFSGLSVCLLDASGTNSYALAGDNPPRELDEDDPLAPCPEIQFPVPNGYFGNSYGSTLFSVAANNNPSSPPPFVWPPPDWPWYCPIPPRRVAG